MAYESLGRGFVSLCSFAIHHLPTTTKALGVELLVFCSVLFLCFFLSIITLTGAVSLFIFIFTFTFITS